MVFEGIQVWDKVSDPRILPLNTLVTLRFKHAKIELDCYNHPSSTRKLDEIEDVEVSTDLEPNEADKEAGYKSGILLTDDDGFGWYLDYQSVDIDYKLPE